MMISTIKIMKHNRVIPKKISSLSLPMKIVLISSRKRVYKVTTDMKITEG